MEKEQLFNCRTDLLEPDWSQFTALTIIAMADYDGRSEIAQPDQEINFYTVFGIDRDGMFDAITDATTLLMAAACANYLAEMSGLPITDAPDIAEKTTDSGWTVTN